VKKPIPKKPIKKVSPKPTGRKKPCPKKGRGQKTTTRHDLKGLTPTDQKYAESIAAGKQVMCETRRQFEKAGFTEIAIAKTLAGIAFHKVDLKKIQMHDKLQALGMAVDVIGIKKPVKVDLNHKGEIKINIIDRFGAK